MIEFPNNRKNGTFDNLSVILVCSQFACPETKLARYMLSDTQEGHVLKAGEHTWTRRKPRG